MFDQDGPSSAAVVMSAVSRTSGYREYGKLEESSLRERLVRRSKRNVSSSR
jgi:hypothetical protein